MAALTARTGHGADLPTLLLSAFIAVLHACSRQQEVMVDVHPTAALTRAWSGCSPTSCRCACTSIRPSPSDSSGAGAADGDQAHANAALPFDRLVQLLNPPKDMSRTALFDVLFIPPAGFTRLVPA